MSQVTAGVGELDLVRRCNAGDDEAYHLLYQAHAGRIKVYFRRSGFLTPDVDDLTQDTFARAFRSLGGFEPARGPFGGWLSAIARNVARKHWARRASAETMDPELAEDMLSSPDNAGHSVQTLEELDALGLCIEALPAELAEIVRFRYVAGMTTRGIATATGIAEATVRLRLAESLSLLRTCMAGKGHIT